MTAAAPLAIGISLKLYLDVAASERWAARAAAIAREHPALAADRVRLFVLPSLPALPAVRGAIGDAPIEVGAQDLFWEDRGPYTGGISGADLREVGCTIVEVGHLERRRVFGEDDRVINLKTAAAFRSGLTPLLCVGEEHPGDPERAAESVLGQLESALYGIERPGGDPDLVVAYEPQWAIGAERPAEPAHVAAVTSTLRETLASHPWLGTTRVIYGGSAGPGVMSALGASIDGLFLGRFAHDPDALAKVLDEAVAVT